MVQAKIPFWKRLLGLEKDEGKMVPDYNDHMIKNPVSVPTKAGDLVIFDVKINHRATQKRVDTVPPEFEKLAIFATFARNNHTLQLSKMYVDQSLDKPMSTRDYPPSVVQRAAALGLFLA